MLVPGRDDADRNASGTTRTAQSIQRTLLFVAPAGLVPECLMDAVEREFAGISVAQVAKLDFAPGELPHPVSLLLVDPSFWPDLQSSAAEICRRHPAAAIALIFDESWHDREILCNVMSSHAVRGVLPMNLKLDLWLSVVRLLLRGGEYFPPWLLQIAQRDTDAAARSPAIGDSPSHADVAVSCRLKGLTDRELQILEMVSRGYQNKVIAAKFNRSEHTVKVHLHHIIKKLGAHNRTSAAAMFLASSKPDLGDARTA